MYESNAQSLSAALTSTSASVFNQDTIDSILSLVSSATDTKVVVETVDANDNAIIAPVAGTEVVFVTTSDTKLTNVAVTGNIPVVFFQGAGGVNATVGGTIQTANSNESAAIGDSDTTERVVVGTAGADTITIVDSKNTHVIAGDKDVVKAGSGHTVVVAAQGSSTVVGGADTIVEAAGKEADFTISVVGGHAKITNATTNVSVDMTGVQYVQLDNTEALIFAGDTKQAVVANLYQAIFGRTADAGGLEYWFDVAERGVSMQTIAQGFMSSSEYTGATQTNAQFLDTLYQELLGRSADAGGNAFWMDRLSEGVSRADVAAAFADAASTNAGEVTVVGSVTIIDGYGG